MIILAIIVTFLLAVPFGYAFGRVHGINQAARAMERYGKAVEAAGGKKALPVMPNAPSGPGGVSKKEKKLNQHSGCGGQWGKWKDCTVKLYRNGTYTNQTVSGQQRFCEECNEKEVRTTL